MAGSGGGVDGVRVLIPAPQPSASYCGSVADLSCEQTLAEDNLGSERRHTKKMSQHWRVYARACGGSSSSG